MRNKNLSLMVCVIAFIANPAFAMLEDEGEVREKRGQSSPIPMVKKTYPPPPKLPISSIEIPEFPVVQRKISKTLPLERRRRSSGSPRVGKVESPRTSQSPRKVTEFSPPDEKKCSPRTSVSPRQIISSSFQDKQSKSPGRDESPKRLLERKSSLHEEQSGSPGRDEFPIYLRNSEHNLSSQGEKSSSPVSPRNILTSSRQDRELSPARGEKKALKSSGHISLIVGQLAERDKAPARTRKRQEGMGTFIQDEKDTKVWEEIKNGMPKLTLGFPQEENIDSLQHMSGSSEEKEIDLPENYSTASQVQGLDPPKL